MEVRSLVVAVLLCCGCTMAPAVAPKKSTDTLLAECRGEVVRSGDDAPHINWQSCHTVARRLQEEGRPFNEWQPHLNLACGSIGAACADLAVHHLEGKVTPVDKSSAHKQAIDGCLSRDGDACGWAAVLYLEQPASPDLRYLVALRMYTTCNRYRSAGWPCTNFGVALSCGLFGFSDPVGGRRMLAAGCEGDRRACDLLQKMRTDETYRPTCDLIGGDPAHPDVKLDLDLTPMGWPEEKGSPWK